MKFLRYSFYLLPFLFLVFLAGCDECEDCDPLDAHDPGISISFIDTTNIIESKAFIEKYKKDTTDYIASLKKNEEALESEGLSEEERNEFNAKVSELKAKLKETTLLLENEKKQLALLSKGEIEFIEFQILGSNKKLSFTRKDTIFRFPLRPDATSTSFLVSFNGRTDTLNFMYKLKPQPSDLKIKLKAKEVRKGTHTFKDLTIDSTSITDEYRAKAYY